MTGKNVVMSDELRNRMMKSHNLEIGVWKENTRRRAVHREKPMSIMLIDKHLMQQQERGHRTLSAFKWERSPGYRHRPSRWGAHSAQEYLGPTGTQDRAVPPVRHGKDAIQASKHVMILRHGTRGRG
jgi:hypothetical protein